MDMKTLVFYCTYILTKASQLMAPGMYVGIYRSEVGVSNLEEGEALQYRSTVDSLYQGRAPSGPHEVS